MNKHIKEYHTCDRCSVEMSQPHNGGENGTFWIKASEDYAIAGGAGLSWQDLCGPCNSYVGGLIRDLQHDQKNARTITATKGHP